MTRCIYAPLSGSMLIQKYDELEFKKKLLEEQYAFEINDGMVEITDSGQVKWKSSIRKTSVEATSQGVNRQSDAVRGENYRDTIAQGANGKREIVKSEE